MVQRELYHFSFLGCLETVRSEDDFDPGGLVGLEGVPDMVAVLGQFLAIHQDAAALAAVAERQGLGLTGGDGGADALLVPVHMIQLGEGIQPDAVNGAVH